MEQQVQVTFQHVLLKLLDWPFLLFVVLGLFILLFRKQLVAVLNRGDIWISWGEHHGIRLRELPDKLDQELAPIRDEIEAIKKAVASIGLQAGVSEAQHLEPPSSNGLSDAQKQETARRMKEALEAGEYRWRSIERLAAIGGVSEGQALNILRSDPDVVLGADKSGRRLARLASRLSR
jgi:hypothetical protein